MSQQFHSSLQCVTIYFISSLSQFTECAGPKGDVLDTENFATNNDAAATLSPLHLAADFHKLLLYAFLNGFLAVLMALFEDPYGL